jgi:hypothetical protein
MTRENSVFNLLANGEIRQAEAARLLGWPRWRIHREARARGINARAARQAYVEREFAQAEAIGREIEASGKPMREAAAEAMAQRAIGNLSAEDMTFRTYR